MHEPLPHRDTNMVSAPRHTMPRDFETRGRVDLRKVGAYVYATHPSTEVTCFAYAVDDGPVQLWRPGDPVPAEVIEAAHNPNWYVAAHNDPSRPRSSGTSWRRAMVGR